MTRQGSGLVLRIYMGVFFLYMFLPLLTPGMILGISTAIFRNELGVAAGLFTAILAQTSFIASYAMLMFMARLQRHDMVLEADARDLGATPFQAFRRITLPFLKPKILTATIITSCGASRITPPPSSRSAASTRW
ncbi:ABC transporter permease [Rhodovulum sp. YEN HP10]|uniref:ABC transporter permease n=1 Tax=Rhodovulum sp. HP10 TaxID=3387397 RepID=UPI0039E15AD7